MIYNGEFANEKTAGYGVTTALLRKEGYTVISEHELNAYAVQPEYATLLLRDKIMRLGLCIFVLL